MSGHDGRFPDTVAAIRALPGIGDYTAAAIASIAFGVDVAAVDANVLRVLARIGDIDQPVKEPAGKTRVRELAERLLPPGRAGDYNQALMAARERAGEFAVLKTLGFRGTTLSLLLLGESLLLSISGAVCGMTVRPFSWRESARDASTSRMSGRPAGPSGNRFLSSARKPGATNAAKSLKSRAARDWVMRL